MSTIHTRTAPSRRVPPAARQPGPVTRAIRGMRPNEAPTWEQRQREIDVEEREAMRALRRRVAQAVADGIDFLDATGGDPDLDADYTTTEHAPDGGLRTVGRSTDDEPSLCGIGGHVMFGHQHELPVTGGGCGGNAFDLEGEDEHGGDVQDEPHDAEEDASDEDLGGEETLGWAGNVGQLNLGPNTADGDATALETYGGGFRRSGHEDDEDSHDREGNTDDNGIADAPGAWDAGFLHYGNSYWPGEHDRTAEVSA